MQGAKQPIFKLLPLQGSAAENDAAGSNSMLLQLGDSSRNLALTSGDEHLGVLDVVHALAELHDKGAYCHVLLL